MSDIKISDSNFLEYLGAEEHNLLASVVNFKSDFDLFCNLDQIYREPLIRLDRLEIPPSKAVIPRLFLFVHFHLYFSVSCILRSHLSECLNSMRKAIDASLSAYQIVLEPSLAQAYENRDPMFQQIKNHVQKEIKKDSSKYPLAHQLIDIHGLCSEFGSHADVSSFFHRLELKPDANGKKELRVHHFQFPKKKSEYQFYFIATLQGFYLMFKIFKIFFDQNLKIIDINWEQRIEVLGKKIDEQRKIYKTRMDSTTS